MKFTDSLVEGHPLQAYEPRFHVALVEPEIPQNTGNIGRTCVGTHCDLHLIVDVGFRITDGNLKRAGRDYWQHLRWKHHETYDKWFDESVVDPKRVFFLTTKADKSYFDIKFQPGDWFVFGRETKGLPEDLLRRNPEQLIKIPMLGPVRSFNVATAVAVVLYEAIRQQRS